MATYLPPICLSCKHYDEYNTSGFTCKAYPKGIPRTVILSIKDHREHLPGDNGIKFELKSEDSKELIEDTLAILNQAQ